MIDVILDTTVLEKEAFDWESPRLLNLLKNHKRGIVMIYIPDIMEMEIERHLHDASEQVFSDLTKIASKPYFRLCHLPDVRRSTRIFDDEDKRESFKQSVATCYLEFKQKGDVQIIPMSFSDPGRVFQRYFATEAPFKNNKSKKCEFPDAFAIDAIMNYFQSEYHVVSGDSGWKDAFAGTDHCVFHNSLWSFMKKLEEFISEKGKRDRVKESLYEQEDRILGLANIDINDVCFEVDDLPNAEITDVSLESVLMKDVIIDEMTDDEASFIIELRAKCNISLSYDDPDSWFRDPDTKDIYYRRRIKNDSWRHDLDLEGEFSFKIDDDTFFVGEMTKIKIDLPKIVYISSDD